MPKPLHREHSNLKASSRYRPDQGWPSITFTDAQRCAHPDAQGCAHPHPCEYLAHVCANICCWRISRTRMASPSPDGYPDHRSQRNSMPQDIAVESLASKVLEVARQYAVHFEMKIMTESIMIENIKICHCDGEHCTITSCATRWQKKYCNHMNSMQGINWSTPLPDPEFAHHTSKTAAL